MDREPEGGLIVPALNLSESSIEDACQESTIAMDVSLVMLPVDAADVPLPDEESDRDEFEVSIYPSIATTSCAKILV